MVSPATPTEGIASRASASIGPGQVGFQFDISISPSIHILLSFICLTWYLIIWSICYLGLIASTKYQPPIPRSPLSSDSTINTNTQQAQEIPGVSILRPLSGLDCNLYTNLCSSFEQQYHLDRFEVILSVRDENDQALGIARQVVDRYPKVNSTIVIGESSERSVFLFRE